MGYVVLAAGLLAGPPLDARGQSIPTGAHRARTAPPVTLRVTDLTPNFLAFYEEVRALDADADRRWRLWKELYDFAALPPVPTRDSIARAMLDEAWPSYVGVIDRIRGGAGALRPVPDSLLRAVAELLELDEPFELRLIVYVGTLERTAFFTASDGTLTIALPVEEDEEWRALALTREFTHAVHHRLAGLSEDWVRTIARTILAEGLAAHVTGAIHPGRDPATYLDRRPGWFAEAESKTRAILSGIRPHLAAFDSQAVMRFSIGPGTTGTEREAYYAGWCVVGHLLRSGYSLAELARVPEDRIRALVDRAIGELLEPH